MNNSIESALLYIADILNKHNITWALGGSLLLFYEGFECDVNDIDILVDINDYEKLKEAINHLPYTYINSDEKYQTEHFFEVTIAKIDIDIMLNFSLMTENGLYTFPFSKEFIVKQINIYDVPIYLSSVDEWEKAYQAMKREDKIELIKKGAL